MLLMRWAAAAILAAGVLATPSPAQAAPAPWVSAPCATGEINSVWDETREWFVVYGAATQCGPTVENGGFRIAYYPTGDKHGYSPAHSARRFPDTAAGTTVSFAAAIPLTTIQPTGVCLITGDGRRTGCVWVALRGELWEPLAPDAALVAKPVLGNGYDTDPRPVVVPAGGDDDDDDSVAFCGTCF